VSPWYLGKIGKQKLSRMTPNDYLLMIVYKNGKVKKKLALVRSEC
jgi:hypothetical protein